MRSQVAAPKVASLAAAVLIPAVLVSACGHKEQFQMNGESAAAYNVRIDRNDNGAAGPVALKGKFSSETRDRAFAFEMTGVGKASRSDTSAEQRAAASQAAIIEAFCEALLEVRRARGETEPEFTADFGPRLHVSRTKTDGGYEIRVTLVSRGVETSFVVRNGKLQHEPYDLHQVRQVFAATNGEFALVGTDWTPTKGECVATVAHYRPAAVQSALVGGMSGNQAEAPAGSDQAQ